MEALLNTSLVEGANIILRCLECEEIISTEEITEESFSGFCKSCVVAGKTSGDMESNKVEESPTCCCGCTFVSTSSNHTCSRTGHRMSSFCAAHSDPNEGFGSSSLCRGCAKLAEDTYVVCSSCKFRFYTRSVYFQPRVKGLQYLHLQRR